MLDAHCHLDAAAFDDDRDAVLARARQAGVLGFIVAGVSPETWPRQSALARAHDDVHVTYGIHPWTAADSEDAAADDLVAALDAALDAADLERPVAIGEIGIDRSPRVAKDTLGRQERLMRAQLALARQRDLPVVLHIVRAHGRALEILAADGLPRAGGQVHAYSGSAELVGRYLALGLSLSFSAAATRPDGAASRAAAAVPDHRLLVETDAPDQPSAAHHPGRNEPAFLEEIVASIASARGVSTATLAAQTERNARALFGLGAAP
jgi:TatD DNase family protein